MTRADTPDSTTSTVSGMRDEEESGAVAELLAESLQCNEDLHMDNQSVSERYSNSSPTSSVAAAMVRDMMSGARSGATSYESSPQSKGRREHPQAGSERSDRDASSGLLSGAVSEVPSEDEQWRKRRNRSVSSVSADAIDGDDCAGSSQSLWQKMLRPTQLALPTHLGAASSARYACHGQGQREGGFALLNSKSPVGGKVLAAQVPQHAKSGGSHGSSGGPRKRRRVLNIIKRPSNFLPLPKRTCVAHPFGLIKPAPTSGENTLNSINQVVRQASLHTQQEHTQQEQLACSSSTFLRSRATSPVVGAAAGSSLAWGAGVTTPPRNTGGSQHDDAAVSTLLCDENLHYDISLCHSPR